MTDPVAPSPTPAPPSGSVRSLVGGFLMVLGILWMLLCGACTLLVAGGSAASLFTGSGGGRGALEGAASVVFTCVAVGLVGAAPGIAMFFIGRALRRA